MDKTKKLFVDLKAQVTSDPNFEVVKEKVEPILAKMKEVVDTED